MPKKKPKTEPKKGQKVRGQKGARTRAAKRREAVWDEVEALVQGNDPEDKERLARALAENRRRAKGSATYGKRGDMIRAKVHNGTIQPLEPFPDDWQEGQDVIVEKADSANGNVADIDTWMDELDRLAREVDPEDAKLLEETIVDVRLQAKELARRGKR